MWSEFQEHDFNLAELIVKDAKGREELGVFLRMWNFWHGIMKPRGSLIEMT